ADRVEDSERRRGAAAAGRTRRGAGADAGGALVPRAERG
ncbi:MAG: hypothetical protein AVDCRST_MAG89-5403, partial [uncultured Gemmatimonadetes bacterium]